MVTMVTVTGKVATRVGEVVRVVALAGMEALLDTDLVQVFNVCFTLNKFILNTCFYHQVVADLGVVIMMVATKDTALELDL